jgi:FAD/FMN-containing dehydrogenase
MPAGNTGAGVVVELTALSELSRSEGDPRLLRAGAGVVAEVADDAARSTGRHLPALPSSAPWCTLGGMVANDAAGARSFRFGPVHAWLREVTWVRADGEMETLKREETPTREDEGRRDLRDGVPHPTSPWPRVRKNSSGYALDRFHAAGGGLLDLVPGSEGTLGVVTEVVVETEPLPESVGVALVGLGSLHELPVVSRVADEVGATACEYFGRRLMQMGRLDADPRLAGLTLDAGIALLEFTGAPDDVEAGLAAVEALGPQLGGVVRTSDAEEAARFWELRHSASPTIARAARSGLHSLQFVEDCVVPPEEVGAYAGAVEEILAEHETDGVIFGHLGDGNLHVNPLVDLRHPGWRQRVRGILDAVVERVAMLGGTLAGEHGDGRLRAPLLERIWAPDHVAAFAALKGRMDPAQILNPGVILPLPGQDPLDGFAAGREEGT